MTALFGSKPKSLSTYRAYRHVSKKRAANADEEENAADEANGDKSATSLSNEDVQNKASSGVGAATISTAVQEIASTSVEESSAVESSVVESEKADRDDDDDVVVTKTAPVAKRAKKSKK